MIQGWSTGLELISARLPSSLMAQRSSVSCLRPGLSWMAPPNRHPHHCWCIDNTGPCSALVDPLPLAAPCQGLVKRRLMPSQDLQYVKSRKFSGQDMHCRLNNSRLFSVTFGCGWANLYACIRSSLATKLLSERLKSLLIR